jgi:hypothetical protein
LVLGLLKFHRVNRQKMMQRRRMLELYQWGCLEIDAIQRITNYCLFKENSY